MKLRTKLLQVFLSKNQSSYPGVFEVSIDNSETLFCTCPGYVAKHDCRHTKFVNLRIQENNGTYPLEISDKATPEDAEKAKVSNEEFRRFIVNYGKIEVY
jgi:hypothetical protein